MTHMSSVMPVFLDALGVPSTRIPIDTTTFILYVLPPVACYFASAVLAVTPQTRAIQFAIWPLTALLSLRALLSVALSQGKVAYGSPDSVFIPFMLSNIFRTLGWALEEGPLVRRPRPKNPPPSVIIDALDLASTFRGRDWEWSGQAYTPRCTRPANRIAFSFSAALSAAVHVLVCGVVHRAAFTMLPEAPGPVPGSMTLFDESLPLWLRYLRAYIISVFVATALYGAMQILYDACTIIGVLFCGQDPTQWPPAFDAPWRATSLSDFWGRRWHQFLRYVFLTAGGHPLSLVLGRSGIVIGAFLASGVWHYINSVPLNDKTEFWRMLVGFGMMGPGILAERAFRRFTGRRVGGVLGWVWTMVWLLTWGSVVFEGYARAPPVGRSTLIDCVPPLRMLVERLVMRFDDWLHTI